MSHSMHDVRKEIERMRSKLIEISYDNSRQISAVERIRIQSLLERDEVPSRPEDTPNLMKQFCVSACSYAPLRRYLAGLIGDIPTRSTIPSALHVAFRCEEFLNDSNWLPEPLGRMAKQIRQKDHVNLNRKQFKPRIIAVLLTGSAKMGQELSGGLEGFYESIDRATAPEAMWKLVNDFAKPISQVGPILICDFFKEIGFTRYVKVDHHFAREFSAVVQSGLSPRESFIESQRIADDFGITPFHLDSIFYLWGRYGRDSRISNFCRTPSGH